ncbi:MAG: RloB family protein [Sandaracinaceae bacterium]
MARRNRKRRPARREPQRDPKRRLLVVCEGIVTEPVYLRGLERWAGNSRIHLEIPKEQGDPKKLVEIAKRHKRNAEDEAKRQRDDFLSFDEVWCVCDVDEHQRLPDARQMARDNDIMIAVSNPCFELWLVLHFRDSPGPQHRHDMQKLLAKFLEGYDKHLDFSALSHGVQSAVVRAQRLDEMAQEEGEGGRNPTTDVYRLAESILAVR